MTAPEQSQPPPLPGASAPVITPPPLPAVPDDETPDTAEVRDGRVDEVHDEDVRVEDVRVDDVRDDDVRDDEVAVEDDPADVTPPRLPTVGGWTPPVPPVPPLPEPDWYPVGPGFTPPSSFPPVGPAQQPLTPAAPSSGQIQSFPRPHAPLFAPAQAPVYAPPYAPAYQDMGDVPRSGRGRGTSSAVTALAMVAALLFVTAAGIGVWWTRAADTRAASIAELKAEHSAFVEAQTAADSDVKERYAALDVPARWAAVVAANEKYAKSEEAFNAAYPTSQRTIPLSAGFALVSAVRQCLTPVLEYNRVAGQFSDEVRAGLPDEVDMASARTNCNVIGWTTAP